jgi:hypothetical protein
MFELHQFFTVQTPCDHRKFRSFEILKVSETTNHILLHLTFCGKNSGFCILKIFRMTCTAYIFRNVRYLLLKAVSLPICLHSSDLDYYSRPKNSRFCLVEKQTGREKLDLTELELFPYLCEMAAGSTKY